MKTGIIIYSREDIEKNIAFVKMCTDYMKQANVSLNLAVLEKEDDEIRSIEEKMNGSKIDFAINRSRNHKVAKYLEEKGIRVFNNSKITEICNDKWATYKYAKDLKLPIMETELSRNNKKGEIPDNFIDNNSINQDDKKIAYPRVIKSLSGHGGSEVFLVKDAEEESIVAAKLGKEYIVQKLADAKGRDIRVYVIGDEIVVAMCRSARGGFKSNFSLGGKAEIYSLNEEEEAIVRTIAGNFKSDYIGIDFIYDGDRLVLNEIEDAVGARMVYANTDIPIIEKYIEYILSKI